MSFESIATVSSGAVHRQRIATAEIEEHAVGAVLHGIIGEDLIRRFHDAAPQIVVNPQRVDIVLEIGGSVLIVV